jgi:rod shape-determining protein MreC
MYYHESGRRKGIYLWIALLVVFIVVLNIPSVKRSRPVRGLRVIANNASFPFKYVLVGMYENSISGAGAVFTLRRAQKENEKLKDEISAYKAKLLLMEQFSRENEKLRGALSFRARSFVPRLLAAEIIGRPGSGWFNLIEINRGSADNIAADSAVINEEGLVGRVFEVSEFSSKVLLITDPSSAVSVIDAETGDMAIAVGNSIGPLKVQFMSATASVKAGDRIVTSGMSEIFPKGVVVGRVGGVSKKDYDIFQKVSVRPAVNFSRFDKVFVILK